LETPEGFRKGRVEQENVHNYTSELNVK